MSGLVGKTALITGSTSGIGLGIARTFASEGADVILNGLGQPDEIEALRTDIAQTYGVQIHYNGADCCKPDDITRMIQEANGVDILVNNAGIQHVAPIEDFPPERFETIIALNMSSNWYAIRAALPYMKTQKWGRIINISSVHGLTASAFKSAYVMAKHGVIGLTKTIALEISENRDWDITVNAICPGYVSTPLVENQLADQMTTHNLSRAEVIDRIMLGRQPQGKFITVDEIGAMAAFLCGGHASKITGSTLTIDGGWTAL